MIWNILSIGVCWYIIIESMYFEHSKSHLLITWNIFNKAKLFMNDMGYIEQIQSQGNGKIHQPLKH